MVTAQGDKNQTWRIDRFQDGIGPSPLQGFTDMRNMNVSTTPGLARINSKLSRKTLPLYASTPTFTADAGTDVLTVNTNLETGGDGTIALQAFTLTTTGTLPAPLALATTYYAIRQSNTTLKVATSLANADAGTAVNITDTGTGTHSIHFIKPTQITHFAKSTSSLFALDNSGRVWLFSGSANWYLLDGNTRTQASGDGLVVWKNYLFVFRNTAIDVLALSGLSTYTLTWTNGWQAISANNGNHSAIVGLDNRLYFLNGVATAQDTWYIGSIGEATAPFTPGTGASYTFNAAALDLPQQPTCLCELGTNLLVGTTGREIYPWDRISASFGIPIVVNESNTYAMVNRNNIVYIFAGRSATIYYSNGSTASILTQLPDLLTGYYYTNSLVVAFHRAFPYGRKILFTLKTQTEGFICSLDPENNNAVVIENTYSGGTTSIAIGGLGSIYVSEKIIYASWTTSTDSAIDSNSDAFSYDNYEAYCVTEMFSPGTVEEPATLNQVELSLVKPLTAGQAVRVSYRKSLADSFTTLVDISFTTYGAIQNIILSGSDVSTIAVLDIVDIQIKIELDVSDSQRTTPEADYVALKFA